MSITPIQNEDITNTIFFSGNFDNPVLLTFTDDFLENNVEYSFTVAAAADGSSEYGPESTPAVTTPQESCGGGRKRRKKKEKDLEEGEEGGGY